MYNIISLLCGIGMFLTGMSLMSDNALSAFGSNLEGVLSRLTKNKISGVATGFAVTGIIQSSCASTVMAVAFVQAGLLSLSGAVGIVMGANIGTTVTSLIIAFDFSDLAPLCLFAAAVIRLFAKKERVKAGALILAGFGLLFIGLNTMASGFSQMKDSPALSALIIRQQGKLSCIIIGFIMTALLQSSSATVGILQSLASEGLIDITAAFYIILGQNIGAVIPVLLSALSAEKQAKQVAIIHLLFNAFGTAAFLLIMEVFPIEPLFCRIENSSMKISLFHIAFNIISTIILLPFSDYLIKISDKLCLIRQKDFRFCR